MSRRGGVARVAAKGYSMHCGMRDEVVGVRKARGRKWRREQGEASGGEWGGDCASGRVGEGVFPY